MTGRTFILNTPLLAIAKGDGTRITVPQNATVKVPDGQPLDGGTTLVEVQWEGRLLLMFSVDLQHRGRPVPAEPSS